MQLVCKIFNLCGHDPPTLQTDRQTDRQTTCDRKTALCTVVHRAVKIKVNVRLSLPLSAETRTCAECAVMPLGLAMHAADCGLVESVCRPLSSAFNSVDRHNSHLTGVKLVRHLHPV